MHEIQPELLAQFRPPAYPGSFFLSFEGIEGSGKSTQILNLKNFLEKKMFRVIILREPGGTSFGEKLRSAILNSAAPLHPLAETFLFLASRAQLLDEVTLKELAIPNTVVIYDRYLDSTLAYQGVGRNLGAKTILEAHKIFPLNLVPHLTFYLKISLETSLKRQEKRERDKDYFEAQKNNFHQKLIEGYNQAAELFPQRIATVDGERKEAEVAQDVFAMVNQLLIK
jgi:dTMP kinase